jgi:hypothetical protein
MSKAWSWAKSHLRLLVPVATFVLGAGAGLLGNGRSNPTSPDQRQVDKVERHGIQLVAKCDSDTKADTKLTARTITRKRTVTRPSPAGPVVTQTETVLDGVAQAISQSAHLVGELTLKSTSATDTKTVETFRGPPRWRFGLGAGYQFSTAPGLVYGAEVDYRLFPSIPLMVGGRVYVVPGGAQGLLVLSLNI